MQVDHMWMMTVTQIILLILTDQTAWYHYVVVEQPHMIGTLVMEVLMVLVKPQAIHMLLLDYTPLH